MAALMPNIASALKEEISRSPVKRSDAKCRPSRSPPQRTALTIAPLKRRVLELERHLRRAGAGRAVGSTAAANEDSGCAGHSLQREEHASQRRRLGLSAAECGLLIGASAQSIYNWEEGKARPRAQHLPAIYALRNLGRRQANEILDSRKAA
jgi:DNA-binding transcriptional regulator YiaG